MDKSKENYVNVPRRITDPHYRYTMPLLRVKVEGRGKMIKTILLNLREVAKDVYRSPEYLLKFFAFELAASTKIDRTEENNLKYIINGQRHMSELEAALDKFIDNFVLCGKCGNPETLVYIKKGCVFHRCKACGFGTPVSMAHKLSNFIVKNPPAETPDQKGAPNVIPPTKEKPKPKPDQSNEDWAVDVSPEAVAARRRELVGAAGPEVFQDEEKEKESGSEEVAGSVEEASQESESREPVVLELASGQDPIELLSKFWMSHPPAETIVEQVRTFQKAQGWNDHQMLCLIFGSLFENLEKNFAKKAKTLSLFVSGTKDEKVLLFCLERLCIMQASLIPQFSAILQNFYNENLLHDDAIFDWYEEKQTKKIPQKLSREIRSRSKEFVDWLE